MSTFEDRKKLAVKAERLHTYLMPTSQRILRAIVDERRRLLARELHDLHRPVVRLDDRLDQLKSQAEAYRQQAIVLNAKLAALSGEQFQTMRETLVQSSAQIDHGVAGIAGPRDSK